MRGDSLKLHIHIHLLLTSWSTHTSSSMSQSCDEDTKNSMSNGTFLSTSFQIHHAPCKIKIIILIKECHCFRNVTDSFISAFTPIILKHSNVYCTNIATRTFLLRSAKESQTRLIESLQQWMVMVMYWIISNRERACQIFWCTSLRITAEMTACM